MDTLNTRPLVSVVIPTFNRKDKVVNAINSVISQSYDNWELIVVDDNSTDDTLIVLKNLAQKNSRISYFINKNKKGPSGARNYAMQRASGKYIAFLDSDDIWYSCHLEDCVDALENEAADVAWGLWHESEDDIRKNRFNGQFFLDITIKELTPRQNKNYFIFNNNLLEYLFIRRFYLLKTSTFFFKTSLLAHAGMFDERLHGGEDSDLFFRLMINAKACIVNKFHANYIQGDDNLFYFNQRSKISNPEIAKKQKKHKTFEIMHYEKISRSIPREPTFTYKDLMLRTVYQTLIEKHLFLLKILDHYPSDEEIKVCKEKIEEYEKALYALPYTGKKYFYLTYSSRYTVDSYCLPKDISTAFLAEFSYWVIIEDHVLILNTVNGIVLYDVVSANKMLIDNKYASLSTNNKSCKLTYKEFEDTGFIKLLHSAVNANLMRIVRASKIINEITIMSSNNIYWSTKIYNNRDPELTKILQMQLIQ